MQYRIDIDTTRITETIYVTVNMLVFNNPFYTSICWHKMAYCDVLLHLEELNYDLIIAETMYCQCLGLQEPMLYLYNGIKWFIVLYCVMYRNQTMI